MADVERALLAKAVRSGELPELLARGIEPEHFADPDCRELYEYTLDFARIHGDQPSSKIVKSEFPDVKLPLVEGPLSYHMERFLIKVKERTAIELVRDFHDAIEDPERVAEIEIHAIEMGRLLSELVPAPRVGRFSEAQYRIAEYQRRERAGVNTGIFYGIPTIDREMLGQQSHELAVIVAYMGIGKSTLIKKIAHSTYLQSKTSLIIALEEEQEAVLRKIDVMVSNVKYWAMKALELEVGDLETWKRIADRAYEDRHDRDIYVVDDINNCTVDHIMSRAMRYKPDIVLVDYLELMRSPRGVSGWEAVSQNAIGLKQIARVLKTPIITAAQLNREGGKGDVTLATVSHQSVGKHSDVIIGLVQDEEKEAQQEMDIALLKNRDGRKARCTMRWVLETMDIREKGADELFPKRRNGHKSLIGPERRKAQRLAVARERASAPKGTRNPWKSKGKGNPNVPTKTSPFTKKARASSGSKQAQ